MSIYASTNEGIAMRPAYDRTRAGTVPKGPVVQKRRPMRLVVSAALLILIAPRLHGQGNGVVEGRLINRTDPSIVARDVDLDVVGLGGGMSILKSATTDKAGRFRIEGLPTDIPIMIRANYKSVNYHGRVNFDAAGKALVDIPVYETTTSLTGIRAQDVRVGIQLNGDQLGVLETWSFNNETNPPRSYMNMEGDFRFSKPSGILEPPKLSVTGPGAAMPLMESALESADGRTYYSLYPLRPGITRFEADQVLPYKDKSYTLTKKFYYDVDSYQIAVVPQDLNVSAAGLTRVQSDAQRNFSIYSGGPVKAGTEIVLTITGGTPLPEPAAAATGESRVKPMPTEIGRSALIIGPLLLIGFIVVLWLAVNTLPQAASGGQDARTRDLRARRDQLLNYLANLDHQAETQAIDQRDYRTRRELGRRQLRRIALLLKK